MDTWRYPHDLGTVGKPSAPSVPFRDFVIDSFSTRGDAQNTS